MKKYKVMVIAHQLKNKVIAKSGDIVDESQLMGNAIELIEKNFIVPIDVDDESQLNEIESVEVVKRPKKK
jgi:hypothetical protein